MNSKNWHPAVQALFFLVLYALVLRPVLFALQTYIFFPVLTVLSASIPMEISENGRMLQMMFVDSAGPSWSLVFGYVSLAFPLFLLIFFRAGKYAMWVLYVHIIVSLITFIIFVVSSYSEPKFALINEWIYTYMMIGLSYAIVALGLAEKLKQKKL